MQVFPRSGHKTDGEFIDDIMAQVTSFAEAYAKSLNGDVNVAGLEDQRSALREMISSSVVKPSDLREVKAKEQRFRCAMHSLKRISDGTDEPMEFAGTAIKHILGPGYAKKKSILANLRIAFTRQNPDGGVFGGGDDDLIAWGVANGYPAPQTAFWEAKAAQGMLVKIDAGAGGISVNKDAKGSAK